MKTTLFINGVYITSREQFEEILHSITDATAPEDRQLLSAVCDGVVYEWAKESDNWNDFDVEQIKAERYLHKDETIKNDWDRLDRLRDAFGWGPLDREMNSLLDEEGMVSSKVIEDSLMIFEGPSTVNIWLEVKSKPKKHFDGVSTFCLFEQECSIDMSKTEAQKMSFSPTKRQLIEAGGMITVKYEGKTFRDIKYTVPHPSYYIELLDAISQKNLEEWIQSVENPDKVRIWLKVKNKLPFKGECVFSLLGQDQKVDMQKSEEQVLTFTPTKKELLDAGGRIEVTTSDGNVFWELQYSVELKPIRITVGDIDFMMMPVEGGSFMMGATPEQGNKAYSDEIPAHKVTVSDYYIGDTAVTQALWNAVMGANPSRFKGDNCCPVERVSWNDVTQRFIPELNRRTGRTFRLPTEAEWEYAARGGNKSKGFKYSGSNDIDEVAWYWVNSGDIILEGTDDDRDWDKIQINNCKTHPVKGKKPNELGLYDMSGNVWEWCQDWFGKYGGDSHFNPTGPEDGLRRVCRGGCWNCSARDCRVSIRRYNVPDGSDSGLGFRLVLDASLPQEEEKKA